MSGSRKKRSGSAQSMRSSGGWNDASSQRSRSSKRGAKIGNLIDNNQIANKTIQSSMFKRRANSASSRKRSSSNPKNLIGYSPKQKSRFINNVASIQPSSTANNTISEPNYRNSLNFISRKKEQARQIEDNIMMLKKIHYAKPSVQSSEHKKFHQKTQKLKKMVSDGSKRQSIVQAARDLIISQEIKVNKRLGQSKHSKNNSSI